MRNVAVVYKSVYGASKEYAQIISKSLQCDLFNLDDLKIESLSNYETIIFGAGVYAGKISSTKFFEKNFSFLKDKNLLFYIVSFYSQTVNEDNSEKLISNNFSENLRRNSKFFFLKGRLCYKELNLFHKIVMNFLKFSISKKPNLSQSDKNLLDSFKFRMDFVDEISIKPLINYVTNL